MNILIYDRKQIPLEQLKHIVDSVREVSGTSDWIALPKGLDVIQDAPIEYLIHYRTMLDGYIEKYQETKDARS
jgi:hypothetical protein